MTDATKRFETSVVGTQGSPSVWAAACYPPHHAGNFRPSVQVEVRTGGCILSVYPDAAELRRIACVLSDAAKWLEEQTLRSDAAGWLGGQTP